MLQKYQPRADAAVRGVGGILVTLLLAACSTNDSTAPTKRLATNAASWAQDEVGGYVRACKMSGPAGTYTFTVSVVGGGDANFTPTGTTASVNFNGTTPVCVAMYGPILNDSWDPDETAEVTITELVPAGMVVTKIDIFNVMLPAPGYVGTLTSTNSATVTTGPKDRYKIEFHNAENPPEEPALGRVTGGGQQIVVGGARISRGFTLHCDIVLANNLEINWHDGNNFHITRPLTSADCFYDVNFDPRPPVAPINTFIGVASGKLNGIEGATAYFTLIDDGESGKNDLAKIQVYDHNNVLVLDIPLSKLDHGNIQMHYDQPHGQKPPKN